MSGRRRLRKREGRADGSNGFFGGRGGPDGGLRLRGVGRVGEAG
jgi:hypothetical protein